ncbi:MAG: hypothetical protein GY817_00970 [bacterium]|nr:hypothetical protein [bacterium]
MKKRQRGQIMYMFLFVFTAMMTFAYLMINLTELSIAKVKLQKAVDAAALAIATYQARAFNAIADKNYILKYPSGDKNIVFPDYHQSGIDLLDRSTPHTFAGTVDYQSYFGGGGYIGVLPLHQNQQDKFASIYANLLPKLAENFILKNDKDALLFDQQFTPLDFRRQYINIQYKNTTEVGKVFEKLVLLDHIPAWMTHADHYTYSIVVLQKELELWGESFIFEAVALGEMTRKDASVWPNPKPEFKARLSPTQEKGVYH